MLALFIIRSGSRTVERSSVGTNAIYYRSVTRRQFSTRATPHRSASTQHRQPPRPRRTGRRPTTGRRPALTPPTRRRSTRSPPAPTALARPLVFRRRCRAAPWTAAAAAVDRRDRQVAATLTNRTRWRGSTRTKLLGDRDQKLWLWLVPISSDYSRFDWRALYSEIQATNQCIGLIVYCWTACRLFIAVARNWGENTASPLTLLIFIPLWSLPFGAFLLPVGPLCCKTTVIPAKNFKKCESIW